jgi:hypothetical protein
VVLLGATRSSKVEFEVGEEPACVVVNQSRRQTLLSMSVVVRRTTDEKTVVERRDGLLVTWKSHDTMVFAERIAVGDY